MKIIASLLLAAVLFTSCDKNDDAANAGSPAALTAAVNTTVSTGTWRVTLFIDNGDETSNFSGYNFTFGSNGTLTAVRNTTTVTGTWRTGTDDSRSKLYISFASPGNFEELSEDWHVLERTDTKIRMQHISGGNGGTDYLTFERN